MTAPRLLVVALVVGATAVAAILAGVAARDGTAVALTGDVWEVTSGDWQVDGSSATTDAPTFRARTTQRDHGDVAVSLRFRIDGYGSEGTHRWDGVHLGVRYASPDDLYYVSVARRDGTIAVKRKAGGEYETLATADLDVAIGEWHTAEIETRTTDGDAVAITVDIDGEAALEVVDDDTSALTGTGRVSIRSDDVEAAFDEVTIRAL